MKTILFVFTLLLAATVAAAQAAPANTTPKAAEQAAAPSRLIVYSIVTVKNQTVYKAVVRTDAGSIYYLLSADSTYAGGVIPSAGIYDFVLSEDGQQMAVRVDHYLARPSVVIVLSITGTYSGEELRLPAEFQKIDSPAAPASKPVAQSTASLRA